MENLLTYYKGPRILHLRCPICGTTVRLVLPDREGAPLELNGVRCKHITISADKCVTKVDIVNFVIFEGVIA